MERVANDISGKYHGRPNVTFFFPFLLSFFFFLPSGVLNEIVHQQLTRLSVSLRRLHAHSFSFFEFELFSRGKRVRRDANDESRIIDSIIIIIIIMPIIMSVGIKRLNVLQRYFLEVPLFFPLFSFFLSFLFFSFAPLYNRNYRRRKIKHHR